MIVNIPDFFGKINDFNVKAIEADAQACKV
jgi:hypothetical protein